MMKNDDFLPEGSYGALPSVRQALRSLEGLQRAQDEGRILESCAVRCTALHDLLFDFDFARGVMPRACCALGLAEGQVREIAVLSRVGKPTCFVVTDIDEQTDPPTVWLSRTVAQRRAQEELLTSLVPGDIIPATVTHLEPFGAFVDIGCGLPSLIGIENLSVSRIYHPSDRLSVGQRIRAVVQSVDTASGRIFLTHRELLGTWEENAALFSAGETVRGIVRSVEPYGMFIELAPNLSGLAENREGLTPGTPVSVYIKSILPQRMKIKLSIIDVLPRETKPAPPRYFVSGRHIDRWVYTPPCCDRKYIATEFTV